MLGALSGCEKEKSATEPVYNPISRLDAEVLLKQWNAERKGRLKSATTLNLTEEQWGRAKVYLSEEEGRSLLTLPLAPGLRLCFGKAAGKAELFFCETRPDSAYLRQVAGKVEGAIFTGYLILYNQQGAGVVAYRYTDGGYEGAYHVMPRVCTLKDMTTDMQYIETVVVTGKWMKKPQPQACVSETDSPGGFGYTSNLRIDANVGDCWSGGGSSGKPDPKPEVADPCAKVRGASNMPGLPAKLARLLQDAKNLQHETGYLVDNRYNYTYKEGYEGDCKVEVGVNTYTVAIIHTHPAMCGNMFSPDDIKLIWKLCQGNAIDKTSFQYGLVTSTGNAYFLSVNDYDKFSAFASRWNLSGDISGLNRLFETDYYNERWTATELETGFLEMIKDAGLTMLKGDASSGNNWNYLTKDAKGNVINNPCNQ